MHKSQLAGFIIDCENANLDTAAEFWSAALGLKRRTEGSDARYAVLDGKARGLHIEVQTVEHPSRLHLDIETDDIEAEVDRLEALGARRIERFERWWVMEAPTGQRFCVVRPQNERFDNTANVWD